VNELEIKRLYGEEAFKRGEGYFEDGRVLTAIRLGNRVFGEVMGNEKYVTNVKLDSLSSSCTCPVGANCKHGVALLLRFLSGDYVDGDGVLQHLEGAESFELFGILRGLIEADPMLLLSFQQVRTGPSAKSEAPVRRQVEAMLQEIKRGYADESFAKSFAKVIKYYEDQMDKELILYVLEFLVRDCEKYGYFYDDYSDSYFGEEIFENLCDALAKKSLEAGDFRRLQRLGEGDDYSMLDSFLARMVTTENAPRLVKFSDHIEKLLGSDTLYIEFLINAGRAGKAEKMLRRDRRLSEQEGFNLYLRIDETEALEWAKERKYYSSMIWHYHGINAHGEAVAAFRTALKEKMRLEESPRLYEALLDSIKSHKPEDGRELLHQLLAICRSFEHYDLCVDIGIELNDLEPLSRLLDRKTDYSFKPDSKLKLLRHLSISEPEKAKKGLKDLAEELINEKKDSAYESAAECVLALKGLMSEEEWGEYLKESYERHYRKHKLWGMLENQGIRAKKERNN